MPCSRSTLLCGWLFRKISSNSEAMKTRTLYIDESGFTGYNLLDPMQPVFAIASTDIDADMAERILRESFPRYQGDEFKFTNIWRTNNKKNLIEFGKNIKDLDKHAFAWIIDKRFAVLTKIVDFLIEPFITDGGYDFYADGFCWKYTNYIHFGFKQFASPELYDALLTGYQAFSRDPSPERLRDLQAQLRIMSRSSETEVQIFLDQMALGAELFEKYNSLENFGGSDELHVTSMMAVITDWRKLYPEDFEVVHDASANFFRRQELWEKITNNNVPEQVHTLGDGTCVNFPLRVISTNPIDSKDSYSVQFCDLLAGLFTRYFDMRIVGDDRKLLIDVVEAGLGSIQYNGIRPATIFPDQIPPRRLSGPDAVDRMTEIIYGPHND
mgnify:CR=1 FL=1